MRTKKIYVFVALAVILIAFIFINRNVFFLKTQDHLFSAAVSVATSYMAGAPSSGAPISGSDTVPVSDDTSNTAPTVLAATLTLNGQTSLSLPSTPTVRGQIASETAVDVAWSVNQPGAQCTAGFNSVGYANAPINWNGMLSGTSGQSEIYIPNGDDYYTLGIKCTWNGQTASASAGLSIGSGNPSSDGNDVTFAVEPVTFTANGQTGSITVSPGTSVLLAWDGGNSPECKASGSWSGEWTTWPGQQMTNPLYNNASYTLTCSQLGNAPSVVQSIAVYVSGNVPSTQTNTQSSTQTTPNNLTTPVPVSTQVSCDQTAQAIVTAAGGCSDISANTYPNIYNACCSVVTKDTLLKALNDALVDGMTQNDKSNLLNLLNKYLSL